VACDVLDQVDACVASGMLTALPGAVRSRHELARLAIEESITPVRRATLHRRVLDALAAQADAPGGMPDLERLAHHAEAAADAEAVRRYAPAAAGRAAQLGAHREAGAQDARALRFADGLASAVRAQLLERQASECFRPTRPISRSVPRARRSSGSAKLRVRSRTEATREAVRLGALTD
jgi:hypothetical protein